MASVVNLAVMLLLYARVRDMSYVYTITSIYVLNVCSKTIGLWTIQSTTEHAFNDFQKKSIPQALPHLFQNFHQFPSLFRLPPLPLTRQ